MVLLREDEMKRTEGNDRTDEWRGRKMLTDGIGEGDALTVVKVMKD